MRAQAIRRAFRRAGSPRCSALADAGEAEFPQSCLPGFLRGTFPFMPRLGKPDAAAGHASGEEHFAADRVLGHRPTPLAAKGHQIVR
jgi:hypothetical protein